MARRVALAALVAFAVIAAILWIPWATKERVVIGSTPVPPPLFNITPIAVKPGSTACQQQLTFSPDTQIAEIGVGTRGKPGPRLAITASASGYRATTQLPAGYPSDPSARFNLQTPDKSVIGQLCFRNAGKTTVTLNGTNEFRTMGRPTLVVDGAVQPTDAKLIFYKRVRSSYLSRVGDIFGHAAIFTPAFFSKGVLMALALLALVGIPVAITYALVVAVREDDHAAD